MNLSRFALVAFLVLPCLGSLAQEEKIKVNFNDLELEAVARQVERVTKKSFVYQDQVLKGKKVTLQSDAAITPDEFYRVFQSVCLMHGLAHVPVKGEGLNVVKIVQAPHAAKESGAHPVLARGDPLPAGDPVVYYLIATRHISGAKAAAVVAPALSPIGAVHAVPNSDLLLVVDVASNLARAENLLSRIDIPGAPVSALRVRFAHATASHAKALLTEVTQAIEKASSGEAGRERLTVVLDERMNSLHLVGPEADVKRAEAFLKEIDQELPQAKRVTGYYRLKNVPVLDVLDIVRQLLGLGTAVRGTDEARAPRPGGPLAGKPSRGLAGAPVMPATVVPPAGEEPTRPEPPPAPASPSRPEGEASGPDVEIVALQGLNTLVVIGTQAVQEEVKKILDNLDKRKGQVLIEVAIIQVTGDDSLESGVEVLFEDPRKSGALVNGGVGYSLSSQADTKNAGFPNVQNLAAFTGGALRFLKPDDISVLLRMISTKANVNILSQPHLLVNDNEQANFTTKVSEPTIATSQGTATTTTSFAGFAEAVTSLKITPQISPEGYLNLRITQTFEEFTGASGTSGVPPPKVSNDVTTMITVPDRYTAIMGGFTRDAVTETQTGIPILKDIPILGHLASHNTRKLTKSRLYLFVRPRILSMDGFADLRNASRDKARDLRAFTRGSRIEGAVGDMFPLESGPAVKEAAVPFDEEPRK